MTLRDLPGGHRRFDVDVARVRTVIGTRPCDRGLRVCAPGAWAAHQRPPSATPASPAHPLLAGCSQRTPLVAAHALTAASVDVVLDRPRAQVLLPDPEIAGDLRDRLLTRARARSTARRRRSVAWLPGIPGLLPRRSVRQTRCRENRVRLRGCDWCGCRWCRVGSWRGGWWRA